MILIIDAVLFTAAGYLIRGVIEKDSPKQANKYAIRSVQLARGGQTPRKNNH